MAYDIKCPKCGQINKALYLEETNGSFICEKCRAEITYLQYKDTKSIPLYNKKTQVTAHCHNWIWYNRPVYSNSYTNIDFYTSVLEIPTALMQYKKYKSMYLWEKERSTLCRTKAVQSLSLLSVSTVTIKKLHGRMKPVWYVLSVRIAER